MRTPQKLINSREAQTAVQQIVSQMVADVVRCGSPFLIWLNHQICWRVPLELNLARFGDLGTIGVVDVDANSGELLTTTAELDALSLQAYQLFHHAACFTTQDR